MRWSPNSTVGASLLWAAGLGFVLQIAIPFALSRLGFNRAALFSIWPGLLPIVRLTGGFFAGLTPIGYVMLFGMFENSIRVDPCRKV